MTASLLALLVLMPQSGPWPVLRLWAIGAVLLGQGLGIGLAWPHLAARVFGSAPAGEQEIAASSVTVVIMVANAFGSALGGLVTNIAGLTTPGGAQGAAQAAVALFGVFAVSPVLAFLAVRRLLRTPGTVA
jgi:predicted MFS family arabinose efflux permease